MDKLDKAAAEPIMPLPEILPSTPNISEKKVNEAPKIVAYEPVAPETLEKFKTDKIILPKIETQAAKLNSPTATIDKLAVNDRSETDPLQLVQEEDSRTAIKNNSELVPPKLNHIPPSSSTLAESGNDSGPADLSEVEAEDKKPFNPENYPSNVDEDSAKIEPQIIKEAMLHVIEELTIVEEHNTELVELIDNSVATQRLELKNKLSVISTAVDELNELIENSSGEAEPANQELQLLLTQFLEILDVQSDVFTEEFITRFYKNNRLSVQAPRPQSPNSKIDVGTREIKKLDKTAFLAYLTDLIGNKLKAIHSHIGKLSINHISFTGSVY